MNHLTSRDLLDQIQPDGSMVISREQLEAFGSGDAKRGRRELRSMLAVSQDREVSNGPTALPTTVRIAGEADESAVLELLLADIRENGANVARVTPERILAHIRIGTRRQGGFVGVIDGPDRKPVAVTILVPIQWWFSEQYFVLELVTYVHPDHRRSSHINDLLSFQRWVVDQWTVEWGYRVYLQTGILTTDRVWSKISLYRRRFRQSGAAFLYPYPGGV